MKYIKLTLFIIIAAVFVFTVYIFYVDRNSRTVSGGGAIGAWVTFAALIIALITGIITLIILLKSPRHYFYIFLVISSIPVFIVLFQQAIVLKKRLVTNKFISWRYRLEIQEVEIWKNIENPKKVAVLLSNTKTSNQDNYNDEYRDRYIEEYNEFKASVYLGLSETDTTYFSKYKHYCKNNKLNKCDIVERFLKFKKPKTERDYLLVFEALGTVDKRLTYCIPYDQDSIKEEDFYFKTLYAKGYKKAALKALHQKTNHPEYYIEQFKKIDDLEYRNKVLKTLIEYADFSNFRLKDFYKLILAQSKEQNFETYLTLFATKLNEFNFKEKEFINQEEHEFFNQLYNLLGEKHSFISSFPNEYVKSQVDYQKEIKGKPFVHFVQFFSQVVNLEHSHPKDNWIFSIKHNNKLIYKGISNKYGCVSYKSYHLKPTDVIEVSLDHSRYLTPIGWQQLLPAWNTEDGAKERFYALGYDPEYYNIYQTYDYGNTTFTLEIAEQIKIDFDNYFDKKWQE